MKTNQTNRTYKLLENDYINCNGELLYRIEAISNIPVHDIKIGDLGGYVKDYDSIADNGWVTKHAKVRNNGKVRDNAFVTDNSTLSGNAYTGGHSIICGSTVLTENCKITGYAILNNATIYHNVKVEGHAVIMNSILGGNAVVTAHARIYKNAYVAGNTIITDNACISGKGSIVGDGVIKNNTRVYNRGGNIVLNGVYNPQHCPLIVHGITGIGTITATLNNSNTIMVAIKSTNPHMSTFTLAEFEKWVVGDFPKGFENNYSSDLIEEYQTVLKLIKLKFKQ